MLECSEIPEIKTSDQLLFIYLFSTIKSNVAGHCGVQQDKYLKNKKDYL